jgi:hypothetical protein
LGLGGLTTILGGVVVVVEEGFEGAGLVGEGVFEGSRKGIGEFVGGREGEGEAAGVEFVSGLCTIQAVRSARIRFGQIYLILLN